MKTILVTGGTGFIGSHTCLALLEKGYRVYVIDSFVNSSPKSLESVKIHLKERFANRVFVQLINATQLKFIFSKNLLLKFNRSKPEPT